MKKYFDREISWLSFNYRVLQEAINPQLPLIERLRFLAIYSSNLDEFYRVRVATYKHILKLKELENLPLDEKIKKLLKKIKRIVKKQQIEFGEIYHNELIPALKKENIYLIDDKQINETQYNFLSNYFNEQIQSKIKPIKLSTIEPAFLHNKGLYLIVIDEHPTDENIYLVNVPTEETDRFIKLPSSSDVEHIILLSDVIRLFLNKVIKDFSNPMAYCIKVSRDAELYLEEEIAETVENKILKSLHKREIGDPVRLLYDETIPKSTLKIIRKMLGIRKNELMPGGRYHNFNDFFKLPLVGNPSLFYEELSTLNHEKLTPQLAYFDALKKEDFVMHFPYQSYDSVIQFVEQAASHPCLEEINITLYRVAKESKICKALIKAAERGKKVTVFSELKARFDEELNMKWANKMKAAGVAVIYSFEELKVHSKICLVKIKEGDETNKYAYFGTGNFNEDTAKIYCDHALLTTNTNLTNELDKVFAFLKGTIKNPTFRHLLVAPFNMRENFKQLIENEIQNATKGLTAKIIIKMNSLEDTDMIDKLYEASNAGVKITIIVRGICCLIPGVEEMSKNIKVISIIDRYLEHGRIYLFHNNGDEKLFLASADWMKRNLSHRVEVGFPVNSLKQKAEIKKLLYLQKKDNVKARVLNKTQSNPYKKSTAKAKVRAQYDFYEFLKSKV